MQGEDLFPMLNVNDLIAKKGQNIFGKLTKNIRSTKSTQSDIEKTAIHSLLNQMVQTSSAG